LKNIRLLRCAHPSSLRRTAKYASFLLISRALHQDVFDQPGENHFFNNLLLSAREQNAAQYSSAGYFYEDTA
jgi:hypothetical protein